MCVFVHGGVCACEFACVYPDRPASDQSGTRMKKNNDAWTNPVLDQSSIGPSRCSPAFFLGPVPDGNYGCQDADAGISFLDAMPSYG